jgi:WXG100 family type VII secretion target
MTIEFTNPEFHASVADVRRAADRLSAARSRASLDVSRLLDGWQGAAATEFAEAWSSWLRSAGAVVSALSGLADALYLFRADLTRVDSVSASSLDALAGRLS